MFSLSATLRQGQRVQNKTVTIRIRFSVVYVQFICNTSVGAEGTKQDCHNQDKVQCGLGLVYLTHLGRGRGYKTTLSQSGQGLVWFMFSLSDTPRQGQGVQNNTVAVRIGLVWFMFSLSYTARQGQGLQNKTVTIRIGFSVVYVQFILHTSTGAVQNNTVTIRIGFSVVYVQFI